MFNGTKSRPVRAFHIYKGKTLNVITEDRPGVLSTLTAPHLPEVHPFQARLFNPAPSEDLMILLEEAPDYDNFLAGVTRAGYDVLAGSPVPAMVLTGLHRILDKEGKTVGAAWDQPGQFACLWWQPADDQLVFSHVALTVYRREWAEELFYRLNSLDTFTEFQEDLKKRGLNFKQIKH